MQSGSSSMAQTAGAVPPKRQSTKALLVVNYLYCLATTLLLPVLPELVGQLIKGKHHYSDNYEAVLIGWLIACKYVTAFCMGPVVASMSDTVGRKPAILFSLATMSVEMLLVGVCPSIPTLFIGKFVGGLGDTTALIYASISDIAMNNREHVTQHFGRVRAIFGVAYIVGPLLGSYLAIHSIRIVYLLAACIMACNVLFAVCCLDETLIEVGLATPIDVSQQDISIDMNTVSDCLNGLLDAWREMFEDRRLRLLGSTYVLSTVALEGAAYIMVSYIRDVFRNSEVEVGVFLSLNGLSIACAQGFLLSYLVPRLWGDETVVYRCLFLAMIQFVLYGISPNGVMLLIVLVVCSPSDMYDSSIRSIIATRADNFCMQGAVQGVLSALRTASMGLGSFVFYALLAATNTRAAPDATSSGVAGVPFYIASAVLLIAFACLQVYMCYYAGAGGHPRSKEQYQFAKISQGNDDKFNEFLSKSLRSGGHAFRAVGGSGTLQSDTDDRPNGAGGYDSLVDLCPTGRIGKSPSENSIAEFGSLFERSPRHPETSKAGGKALASAEDGGGATSERLRSQTAPAASTVMATLSDLFSFNRIAGIGGNFPDPNQDDPSAYMYLSSSAQRAGGGVNTNSLSAGAGAGIGNIRGVGFGLGRHRRNSRAGKAAPGTLSVVDTRTQKIQEVQAEFLRSINVKL